MNIVDTSVYVGPNIWANFRVIRLTIDLGPLEEWPTGRLGAGFQQGLLAALPGLWEHRCSHGVQGGFVRRLTEGEGTWLGHVLEHSAIEIQCMAATRVAFGRARGVAGRPGVYDVVFEYADEEVGLGAGDLAFRLIRSLLPAELRGPDAAPPFDFARELAELRELARSRALGPSTAALVRAAERRKIPWERFDGDHLILFGQGARQRRIQAAVTDRTSDIAVDIAKNKSLANRLLGEQGIPVPRQARVDDEEETVAAAERIGYPVVVKPLDGNQGRGVCPDLRSADEVRAAYHMAVEKGSGVLVEEHIAGFDHRMLVVGGALVAAARRIPGHVIGDGTRTIEALVEHVNADPRRGEDHDSVLTRLVLDEEADRMLERAKLGRQSVPAAGQIVYLRATANLSRGGTAVDVTEIVHPDNRLLAERAAATVGLDVAGVDFITTDITRSHLDVGGAVNEVNAAPGLRMHLSPSRGRSRRVADAIIDQLYPVGAPARIPVAAITGTNGKTTTAHMVAAMAEAAGNRVGLTTTNGVYFDGQQISACDASGPQSARLVLRDPNVDVAVLETARGGILRQGLAFRYCTVGAVLNVTADHLGLGGVESLDDLARVKRTVVEAASDVAVLNADDPYTLAMADQTSARTVCLVSMHADNAAVRRHLAAGGRAVVLEHGDHLVYVDGDQRVPLVPADQIPSTHGGRVDFSIQNSMFASAIALGMGIDIDAVRAGLRAFESSVHCTPGRLNVYDGHAFRVVMDYGHNPAAVRAMCTAARRLGGTGGRTVCVLAAPGDRRDDDVAAVGRAAAGLADYYICRRDDDLRGRAGDEVPKLLRDALVAAGVEPEKISVVPDEARAMDMALAMGRAGDLLMLFADDLKRTWKQIVEFRPAPEVVRAGDAAEERVDEPLVAVAGV